MGKTPRTPSVVLGPASPLRLDRAAAGNPAAAALRSTARTPLQARPEFWRHPALQRMDPIRVTNPARGPCASVTHIVGAVCDFIGHASGPMRARRDTTRLKRGACDDLLISLVGDGGPIRLRHADDWRLTENALCIVRLIQAIGDDGIRFRDVTLVFRGQTIAEAVKGDPWILAGRVLPRQGMAALLRSHMRCLAEQAGQLSEAEKAVALATAGEMALRALQVEFARATDEQEVPCGLYTAAMSFIRRRCWDPDLDASAVVRGVRCSRATLYRAFAARGESVAKVIWTTRLDGAHRMLISADHRHLFIDEVGFRNGFADIPTFNRMFKRRYGATPREVRG